MSKMCNITMPKMYQGQTKKRSYSNYKTNQDNKININKTIAIYMHTTEQTKKSKTVLYKNQ